jgi:hypothetical protein
MYDQSPSRVTDIIDKIIRAAQWWRESNNAAKTKEERAQLKQQLKAVQKYLSVDIKNAVDLIDDQRHMLDIEKKQLLRLKTIASTDIEFAEDHIASIMRRYGAGQDEYAFYYMRTQPTPTGRGNRYVRRKKVK